MNGCRRCASCRSGSRAIGRVADPVVAQRDGFSPRLRDAEQPAAVAVHAVLELVDVVADVDHGIEIVAVGDAAVDVEEAGGIVRAAERGEANAIDVAGRQRPRAADGRSLAAALEHVVVRPAGLQAPGVDLDGEVAVARSCATVPWATICETAASVADAPSHSTGDVDRGVRRRDARPQDHAVGQRIAAGDAVAEEPDAASPDDWACSSGQTTSLRSGARCSDPTDAAALQRN